MAREKESLYIPVGVKNRKEYFNGFGREELFATMKASAVLLLVALAIYIITGFYLNAFMFMIAGVTMVVIMLTKTDVNISAVDTLRFIIEYQNEQRVYDYRYQNEYK